MFATSPRNLITACLGAVVLCGLALGPARGDTRAERRIEDLRYAIRDKQKVLDQLGAQREKIDPIVNREKTAYEQAQKKVDTLEAELAEARKAVGEANNALQDIVRQLQEQISAEPRVVEVQEAADAARQRHDQLREKAVASITESAEYRAIVDELETRQNKLKLMRESTAELDPLMIQSLQFEVNQLQIKANQHIERELAKMPEVVEAREATDLANQRLAEVRARFNQQIENNPQRRAAEKTATDARLRIADLSSQLREARRELARAKSRYARAYAVMAQLQKKIDHQEKLMQGLHDELELARKDY